MTCLRRSIRHSFVMTRREEHLSSDIIGRAGSSDQPTSRFRACRRNAPTRVADELTNDYQSLLVVVVVMAVVTNDYHMVVVAAVMAMMTIGLRKSAGCKEHKERKYQTLIHVRTVTNAHNDCLSYIALIPPPLESGEMRQARS
jgi:hypothetical protein